MRYLENKKIRNPTKKLQTFRQNHSTGIISRRLDYIYISNKLQEFCNDTDIIPAFKTNHSFALVTILFFKNKAQVFGNLITH